MIQPRHFLWRVEGKVGVVTLNRPERKNPLTFESYAELRDFFLNLSKEKDVKAIVITGAGGMTVLAVTAVGDDVAAQPFPAVTVTL